MASSTDYLYFVLELLREVDGVSYRKMMGEYILYRYNVIFGGIYDNRFLVKKTSASEKHKLKDVIPYEGAKVMSLVDSEDPDEIKEIVLDTIHNLQK